MKEILNKCRCCCQGSNTWATQLILKQSTSLHRGANRSSIEAAPHWSYSEANPGDSYPWEGVRGQVARGCGPFKKTSAIRGAPAGEGEREEAGPVARGNQLPSNRLPLCKLRACN